MVTTGNNGIDGAYTETRERCHLWVHNIGMAYPLYIINANYVYSTSGNLIFKNVFVFYSLSC